jgi:23S rRNA (cytidine1920-2'-O)/16S rRNA (cytidine1409-2'-O)-methyltransferase
VRSDPRVVVLDRTNVRHLVAEQIGGAVDVVVADLSFISLRSVLDALLGLVAPGGDLVVLVKPQFEASRAEADRVGGVIVDPAVWAQVLNDVIAAFAERGATIMGAMPSPIRGGDGNVEFLLHAVAPDPNGTNGPGAVVAADSSLLVRAALADVER